MGEILAVRGVGGKMRVLRCYRASPLSSKESLMKRISILLFFATTVLTIGTSARKAPAAKAIRNNLTEPGAAAIAQDGLERAKALVKVINQYRREQGLEEIPYSPWLTYVARWHVYDLQTNNPNSGSCSSMHSWSDKGSWSSCCNKKGGTVGCSWDKPREISKGAYKGVGFEIASGYKGYGEMTNYEALESWKRSPPHLNTLLNRDKWAKYKWKAIGAAISNDYAVVWFSEEIDTSGLDIFFYDR